MHRFLCPAISDSTNLISITDRKEIHHLKDVLRLKPKDTIIVFDGKGKEAVGTIISLQNHSAEVHIKEMQTQIKKSTVTALACAIPKKAKFEYIIEKCTELGVDEIIPLKTQRTQVTLKGERAERKILRYQTVANNAAKQSKRKTIPRIYPITAYEEALKILLTKDTVSFVSCLMGRRQKLFDVIKQWEGKTPSRILFFIGPEGDFTPAEITQALAAGCIPVTLGETVLKVDTAAITVMAFMNLFLADEK